MCPRTPQQLKDAGHINLARDVQFGNLMEANDEFAQVAANCHQCDQCQEEQQPIAAE